MNNTTQTQSFSSIVNQNLEQTTYLSKVFIVEEFKTRKVNNEISISQVLTNEKVNIENDY